MGLFKKLKKAFKKVTSSIKKVVKRTLSGLNKIQKKIRKSKLFKALVIAGAVIVTGGAAIGAFTGGTATGWAGWMMNASNTIAGGTLFGTGATGVTGALQTAGNFATSMVAKPFAAIGSAAGTAAATVTDFTGLTTEASRTGINVSQQAAIAGQPVTSTMPSLSEEQILQKLNPAEVAKAQQDAFFMPSTSVESQLASSTQAAFESGSAIGTSTGVVNPTLTTTAGSLNVPTALPSASYATGTPAQQLAQTVPSALGVSPTSTSVEAVSTWAQRNPRTASFLTNVGTGVATSVATGYAMQQIAGDPELQGSMSGLRTEGATQFDPLRIYAAERGIADTDISKYFTFGNTAEAGNMPLFQQQTIGIA
jgi:hypothetical protein